MGDIQKQVQDTLDELVETVAERGVQVAVYLNGDIVVDAVAGVADPATQEPVTADTLFYTYSTGKAMTSTAAHLLVERGLFGYDTPVVELWPQFGAHGKEAATVRHVLTHTVGVPGLPADITPADVCDWDGICARIADLEPWWEPGTKTGYHAYTYGFLVGEIVRRASGRRISEVLRDDIAGPVGAADELYFGVPEDQLYRLATLEDAPGSADWLASLPDDDPVFSLAPRGVTPTAEFGNRADVLMADIPAGGKMSARAIARLYAALLGDVEGVELISAERLREITTVVFSGTDEMFGMPVARGLGWDIGYIGGAPLDHPTMFGWGGVGGSYAFADSATGLAFALTKNRLSADFATSQRVSKLVLEAV